MADTPDDREEYEIRLRPLAGAAWTVPVNVRLRRLLKMALRAYGFVATSARRIGGKETNE